MILSWLLLLAEGVLPTMIEVLYVLVLVLVLEMGRAVVEDFHSHL